MIPVIEPVLNKLLQMDEVTSAQIKRLAGRKIVISVNDLNLDIHITLTDAGLSLDSFDKHVADVSINATLPNLIIMLMNINNPAGRITNLEISGDVGLAQEFQGLLRNLEIDWEEILSQWIGDYPARKTGLLVKAMHNYMKETRHAIAMDISEYLRFEMNWVPLKEEVDAFNRDIDVLRDDSERLQLRIKRLEGV